MFKVICDFIYKFKVTYNSKSLFILYIKYNQL